MQSQDQDARRRIPSIQAISKSISQLFPEAQIKPDMLTQLARFVADHLRADLQLEPTLSTYAQLLGPLLRPGPQPVINATGVLLHTNLGRAPLDVQLISEALQQVSGYTDLEFDLADGERGYRDRHFADLARMVWGVEDATLVNNAAAAVCLSLAALGGEGETIVSRGELIEIGGSFRLPDIMAQAGTRLREVGTTNKTRISDYAAAINPASRVLFKTHLSNYRIVGFTESVPTEALRPLADQHGLAVVEDLGSGLSELAQLKDLPEDTIETRLKAKPDLLIFSGDKLLGSLQAGVVLGKAPAIRALRAHPMMRMLRMDKLSIAVLCRHLAALVCGRELPLARMVAGQKSALGPRAQALCACHPQARIAPDVGYVGGGSLPQEERSSMAIVLKLPNPHHIAAAFRARAVPIVGYVRHDCFYLNLACVEPDQDQALAEALRELAQASNS